MLRAEKGNKVISIQDEEKDYYLTKGYDIYTTTGEVVEKCVPTDLGQLRSAYVEHEAKIAALTKQVEELTKTINADTPETERITPKAESNTEPKKTKARTA